MLKFGRALEASDLPIDIIAAGVVPEGYRSHVIDVVSENARLLAGTALDARGVRRGYLLRLRDMCDPR